MPEVPTTCVPPNGAPPQHSEHWNMPPLDWWNLEWVLWTDSYSTYTIPHQLWPTTILLLRETELHDSTKNWWYKHITLPWLLNIETELETYWRMIWTFTNWIKPQWIDFTTRTNHWRDTYFEQTNENEHRFETELKNTKFETTNEKEEHRRNLILNKQTKMNTF